MDKDQNPNPIITKLCTCGRSITRSASHQKTPEYQNGKASRQHIYFEPRPSTLEIDERIQVAQKELSRFRDAIKRQKVLLERLKTESREIEAYIEDQKTAIAPVRLLTGDALGEIFNHLCGPGHNRMSNSKLATPALNVSRVCSLWRAVATQNLCLWNDITIELDRTRAGSLLRNRPPMAISLILSHYLKRSGNIPLAIRLIYPTLPPGQESFGAEKFGDLELEILATISPHSHRIASLTAPAQAIKWWANPVSPNSDGVPSRRPPTYLFDNRDTIFQPSFFIALKLKKLVIPYTNELLTADTAKLFNISSRLTEVHCSVRLLSGIISSAAPSITKLVTHHVKARDLQTISTLCPKLKHLEVHEYSQRGRPPRIPSEPRIRVVLNYVQTLTVDIALVSSDRNARWMQDLRLPSLSNIDVRSTVSRGQQFGPRNARDTVEEHPEALLELIERSELDMGLSNIKYDGALLSEIGRERQQTEGASS